MRDDLKDLLRGSGGLTEGRNRLREFLQARILSSLQRAGAMVPLAFQGGTALRFLYSISRYSEDLDFALERPDRGYDFRAYLQRARGDLIQEGFEVEVKINDQRVVHSAFVAFPGLLKGRDLYDLIWYLSDRSWPAPNLVLLNNALRQTGWNGPPLGEETWRSRVAERVRDLDWEQVPLDVKPFLEDTWEIELVTRQNVLAVL